MELLEITSINKHIIKLIKRKQLLYGPIYAFNLVELEILKAYIKTYFKTGFIQPFKYPKDAPIFLDKKFNRSLHLYVNYQDFNNLMIKN